MGLNVAGLSNFMNSTLRFGENRDERALDQRQFECVFLHRSSASQQARRNRLCPMGHLGFSSFDTPRLVRDATDRDAAPPILLNDGRDRNERKCVRRAIAYFPVDMLTTDRLRERHRGDELVWRER